MQRCSLQTLGLVSRPLKYKKGGLGLGFEVQSLGLCLELEVLVFEKKSWSDFGLDKSFDIIETLNH